jgi:hypothetical protein
LEEVFALGDLLDAKRDRDLVVMRNVPDRRCARE